VNLADIVLFLTEILKIPRYLFGIRLKSYISFHTLIFKEIKMQEINTLWNSLEIAKLLVPLLATLIMGLIFLRMEHRLLRKIEEDRVLNEKNFEEARRFNDIIIQHRLEVYDKIVPSLNDLVCFYTYVGHWKALTPDEILSKKRALDKEIHIHKYLFSALLFERYSAFMGLCFETFTGIGEDAKLRTKMENRYELPNWLEEYEVIFSDPATCLDKASVTRAYEELLNCFSQELGVRKIPNKERKRY